QKKDLKPGEPPIDLYLEGSDQHRGWFHSSLLESCGTRGHAPYKAVLTHGFVLDEKGYKMSKSLGNVVDPLEMMQQHGADIIRLWTMLSDYSEDIRIGKDTLKLTADLYRRIRNTFRYLLGALDGFTEDERVTDLAKMPELERLVLHWLHELDGEIREHVKNYEFGKLAHRLHNFCTNELSAFYFDIRKDRLYCDRPDLFERRACRTVMAHLFDCLTAWLAPILAFTAEEAWGHRPAGLGKEASVHLRTYPPIPSDWRNEKLVEKWSYVGHVRREVFAHLERQRHAKKIGSSLEANLLLKVNEKVFSLVANVDLADIMIVSDVKIEKEAVLDSMVGITFQNANGTKCARCWKVLPEVGKDKEHKDVCLRCADAVREFKKKDREAA
ncbi:MAG TPA: class I tRNA ligase family protein, partial [Patescibacteria group bacterium]|nr:class I tRNA ligase family protein [Patescibacteria group bacterium]